MYVVQRAGTQLLLVCLLLIGLGLVMIYSASSELARVRYGDSSFFLKRQLARAVLGLFVMCVDFDKILSDLGRIWAWS